MYRLVTLQPPDADLRRPRLPHARDPRGLCRRRRGGHHGPEGRDRGRFGPPGPAGALGLCTKKLPVVAGVPRATRGLMLGETSETWTVHPPGPSRVTQDPRPRSPDL